MTKFPERGNSAVLSRMLTNAGLNTTGEWFAPHWGDSPGWFVKIENYRLGVKYDYAEDYTWFDSLEEADAWVLACWRMK